ncbi:MAG: competence/damage-inducible protein A [Acidobacteria bacterium]|nr:competence/damage-inducible protein A [Acidobacteriota bacterium]
MLRAYLIAIGSELLYPGHDDANAIYLKNRLFEIGIPVEGISAVGDEEMPLMRVLESVAPTVRVIIMTGGLGPTEDDITKKAVARHLNRTLQYNEDVKRDLEHFFVARHRVMPDNCLRQALIPQGGKVLKNHVGTAPGIIMDDKNRLYVLLPGPPREMQPMFEEQVLPELLKRFGKPVFCRKHFRMTGIPESVLDQAAAPLYQKYADIQTTVLSRPGDIELIFTGRDEDCAGGLEVLCGEIRAKLGDFIYSEQGAPLEEEVGRLLVQRRLTLSTAESCTGGLLSKRMTDIPGSSVYFLGGVVCYSNESKIAQVGVPRDIIERHGAVSPATAAALAATVKIRFGADSALSVTGIAGPGGGTTDKPVGLVYIGVVVGERREIKKYQFFGDREMVRYQSTQAALDVLRRMLSD